MKKISLVLTLVLFSVATMLAQRNVTGLVSDESGEALIGASVLVTGTSTGTVTDIDGKYSLSVPADGKSLTVSYTGYANQVVELGASNVVDVTLSEGVLLNTVTVNALGLTVDRDKEGTTSTTVEGGAVVKSGETGVLQGLAGKSSGVSITKNTGDPGAGAYIQIRGQSTITGNLQPLIVVDGMPMFNSSINTEDNTAGVVEQSRINDINPDDIASVEVLKGAAAATVWGTRASNGVIIITTKKGKAGAKKFNVGFRSTYSLDKVSIEHDLQDRWGQGVSGNWIANNALSWGDFIDDRSGGADVVDQTGEFFTGTDGTVIYPIVEKNSKETYLQENRDQVFRNGNFWDNSFNISSGDEQGSFYFSMANLNQEGVIAGNSDYDRTNIRLNAERRLGDKFKVSVNTSYAKINSNRIQGGSNLQGLYLGYLRTASDVNNTNHTGVYTDADGVEYPNAHRAYRDYLGNRIGSDGFPVGPIYNNPGWTINEQENTTEVDRVTINGEAQWNPTSWLNFTLRSGVDNYTDYRFTNYPRGSAVGIQQVEKRLITERQINTDFFVRASKSLGSKINGNILVGYNFNRRDRNNLGGLINQFILPYAPADLSNAIPSARSTFDVLTTKVIRGGYSTIGLDVDDQLFIDLSGRVDEPSTVGVLTDRFVFYPSASAAWQFTQLKGLKNNNVLSFGKLRASWGQVGVEPNDPYSTNTVFIPYQVQESWGPLLDPAAYGNGAYSPSNRAGNPELGIERKTEFEVGADLRFVENRIGLGVTYYANETVDAIFAVDVPRSTGFDDKLANAGTIENKGFELDLDATIIRKNDLTFSLFGNFTRNRNLVTDLQGVESIFLNGFTGSSSRAVEGQPLGTLWGGKFAVDEAGNKILDENGYPTVAAEEGVLGDPNPDFRAGLGGDLRWKGFGLNFLFETAQGQDMWYGTEGVLRYFGRSTETDAFELFTEDQMRNTVNYSGADLYSYYVEGSGMEPQADGTYRVRGKFEDFGGGDVFLDQEYYLDIGGGFGAVGEQFVKDASWTRLREVTLSYMLNNKAFQERTKLGNIEFSVTGRNLFIATDADGVDPDLNLTGATNGRGLDYFTNPGTRSYLFTIKVNY